MDPISKLVRGRTRRALLLLLPLAAGVAALLGALTLDVTAGEAGVVVAAAAGLWLWLGTVRRRVEESRQLALTDDLTGLGNRRRLLGDLERAIGEGTDHSPSALAMFDLDGFKAYNDTHGHPAGDALLARLGARLGGMFAGPGAAYRLGGDEFCVLLHGSPAELEEALASALAALTEEEADVRPSYGFALLPREARDPSTALRIVDQRMYAQKDGRRASTKLQARDILFALLDQHAPDLRAHSHWVSDLARSVAQRLGLPRDRVEEIALAADLHDVGKAVVPRSILDKPGPLDKSEWEIMRRHTAVGEAVLSAAPALRGVAALVRATHERIDGAGYPDGLAGGRHPARRPHRRRLRRVRRDDERPRLPAGDVARGGARGARCRSRHAVRPGRRRRRPRRPRAPGHPPSRPRHRGQRPLRTSRRSPASRASSTSSGSCGCATTPTACSTRSP